MPTSYSPDANNTAPAEEFDEFTPADVVLNPKPRGVWASGAGTVTMTDKRGKSCIFTTTGAGVIPVSPTKITAATVTVIPLY